MADALNATLARIAEGNAPRVILVGGDSEYLAERNWFQVSLMGHRSAKPVECLLAAFGRMAVEH